MFNILPTMEPKGNELQALSDLNRARVCQFIVMPAQATSVDWFEGDWCCDMAEAVEIAKTHDRVTGEPATIWRTPQGEPYAISTRAKGQWISPRAATYRGVPYWAHLVRAL